MTLNPFHGAGNDAGLGMAELVEEEPVCFRSQGQQVIGVIHRPATLEASAVPAVVLCHGFTGTKVEAHRLFVKTARALARAGIAALRFDFRGSGDSAGEFEEMTVSGEVQDALAALGFAREHVGRPVALVGLSLGGAVATLAAARDGDVAALVLWAAVAQPARLAQRMAVLNSGEPSVPTWQGHFDLGGNLVGKAFVEDLPHHQPLVAAAEYRGPVLVVHGTRDETVPPADADAYMQAFRGPDKTLHLVADADHTFNRASWEHEVISTTVAWLKARLLAGAQ